MSIVFRNFIPKDDDLKQFWVPPASFASKWRETEARLDQAVENAKQVQGSKTPLEPNWDLKRTFASRNAKLAIQTEKAIAKLSGSVDDTEEMEEGPVLVSLPPSAERLSFIEHPAPLSDDDDDDFLDAKRLMGSLNRSDVRENADEED
jgi:hypothetical protein